MSLNYLHFSSSRTRLVLLICTMSLKGRALIDGVTGTTLPPAPLPTLSASANKESGGSGSITGYNQQQRANVNQQMAPQLANSAVQLPAYSGASAPYRQQQQQQQLPAWPQAQQPLQQPQQYGGIKQDGVLRL